MPQLWELCVFHWAASKVHDCNWLPMEPSFNLTKIGYLQLLPGSSPSPVASVKDMGCSEVGSCRPWHLLAVPALEPGLPRPSVSTEAVHGSWEFAHVLGHEGCLSGEAVGVQGVLSQLTDLWAAEEPLWEPRSSSAPASLCSAKRPLLTFSSLGACDLPQRSSSLHTLTLPRGRIIFLPCLFSARAPT